ncbi:MAG: hypothetical protein N3E51_02300 [Candidatus Micrarchaeota archaeon]|nr:hypothetical protein [Candidatus Micrarchaeota archaeon]
MAQIKQSGEIGNTLAPQQSFSSGVGIPRFTEFMKMKFCAEPLLLIQTAHKSALDIEAKIRVQQKPTSFVPLTEPIMVVRDGRDITTEYAKRKNKQGDASLGDVLVFESPAESGQFYILHPLTWRQRGKVPLSKNTAFCLSFFQKVTYDIFTAAALLYNTRQEDVSIATSVLGNNKDRIAPHVKIKSVIDAIFDFYKKNAPLSIAGRIKTIHILICNAAQEEIERTRLAIEEALLRRI